MTWPHLFAGWRWAYRSADTQAVRVRLVCGCEATWYPDGALWHRGWCPTHRGEWQQAERGLFARATATPATDAEVREFLEGIGAQKEGEMDVERARRRRGAATLPSILLGLTLSLLAMGGIAGMGHHLHEFVTVMGRFGVAVTEVAR